MLTSPIKENNKLFKIAGQASSQIPKLGRSALGFFSEVIRFMIDPLESGRGKNLYCSTALLLLLVLVALRDELFLLQVLFSQGNVDREY